MSNTTAVRTKLKCGCIPDASGFGWCSECKRKLNIKIWRSMSSDKKAYDRHFDPHGSRALDYLCYEENNPNNNTATESIEDGNNARSNAESWTCIRSC
jgi:hypothetical protein